MWVRLNVEPMLCCLYWILVKIMNHAKKVKYAPNETNRPWWECTKKKKSKRTLSLKNIKENCLNGGDSIYVKNKYPVVLRGRCLYKSITFLCKSMSKYSAIKKKKEHSTLRSPDHCTVIDSLCIMLKNCNVMMSKYYG